MIGPQALTTTDASRALKDRLEMLWEELLDDTARHEIACDLAEILDEVDPEPFTFRADLFGRRSPEVGS